METVVKNLAYVALLAIIITGCEQPAQVITTVETSTHNQQDEVPGDKESRLSEEKQLDNEKSIVEPDTEMMNENKTAAIDFSTW